MTKKRILIFSALIIVILVVFNIYIYTSNNNVNTQIQESSLNAQSLTYISNFRIDINKMAQAKKLYILTSRSDYKSEYEIYLKKIYTEVDELYKNKIIDKSQYIDLKSSLDDYKTLNSALVSSENENISAEMENLILNANEYQLKLLSKLDDSIDATKDSITEQNNTIKNSTDLQINVAQATSTIITSIITIFLYLIRKYSKSKDLDDILKCLIDFDDDNDKDEYISDNNHKNDIDLINETIKNMSKL